MSNTIQISQASSLTGETVIMKTKSSVTGELMYVTGTVDYVVIESNKAYLCINGGKYSIDDLDTVIDADYWEKYKDAILNGGSDGSDSTDSTTGSGSAGETDPDETDDDSKNPDDSTI